MGDDMTGLTKQQLELMVATASRQQQQLELQ